MEVRWVPDVEAFAELTVPFLSQRPGTNNLALGILERIESGVYRSSHHWVAIHRERVVGVAMRTPPYPLVLAEPLEPAAVVALADAIGTREPDIEGVVSIAPWGERFVQAWGGAARLAMDHGVYELTTVRPARPSPGAPRPATPRDRSLILRWMEAFADEALLAHHPRDDVRTRMLVDLAMAGDGRSGFTLWEDAGRAVSLTGFQRFGSWARLGPVYTPPDERRRGYASNLVGHVSGELLVAGARACFLYTDLSNPTSNRIYTDVGYGMIARSQEYVFEP